MLSIPMGINKTDQINKTENADAAPTGTLGYWQPRASNPVSDKEANQSENTDCKFF